MNWLRTQSGDLINMAAVAEFAVVCQDYAATSEVSLRAALVNGETTVVWKSLTILHAEGGQAVAAYYLNAARLELDKLLTPTRSRGGDSIEEFSLAIEHYPNGHQRLRDWATGQLPSVDDLREFVRGMAP